jgi:signal peptidase I
MAKQENRESKLRASPPPTAGASPPPAPAPSTARASQSSTPVLLRWFLSKTVRQATAMRKHVQKLLNHQRDILAPQAIEAVQSAMASCQQAVAEDADRPDLEKQMENLEKVANQWLKPYPNAAWRENVEVLLVALAVAMGIRTFFLQPFKIPTGSMQPTLYGVTSQNLINEPSFKIPTGLTRLREWFAGVSYIHIVAENDGPVEHVDPPVRLLIFNIFQKLVAGGKTFMIWFPPDYGDPRSGSLEARAGLQSDHVYRKGEDIVKLRVNAGDHLFVDRMSYNLRSPKRGEIIVFETKGIDSLPQDQFYIKRMVAMGGERVQVGDDRHLIINGKRLDASTPHFENVYSFNPKELPRDSHYSGHVNEKVQKKYYPNSYGNLAPLFPEESTVFTIQPNHYMVMGDNTMNSYDSRGWGEFPATNVIGKSFFVYWPITDRFGWANR